MKFHPLAEIFPLIEGAQFADLVADVRASGLREPIVTLDGAILDGRNRYRASLEAGVDPQYRSCEGDDPLGYVISLNLQRRHLDESQRAMIAAKLATMPQGARTDLVQICTKSSAEAGQFLNVSERSVKSAKKVQSKGVPGLIKAVEDGKIAVSIAAKLADTDEATQAAAVAAPAKAAHLAKQKARQAKEAELATKQAALPHKRYGVILADPEWRFEPWSRETGMDRAADNHYPTSDLALIKTREIASIAAADSVLFLWATAPMLLQALEVMRAWGFAYKTQAMWAKDRIGTGYWFRNKHELLLVGTRGDVPAPAPGTQWESLISAPVGAHSEKPAKVYELIEAYFPNLPKIELNARARREGWDAWGLEAA